MAAAVEALSVVLKSEFVVPLEHTGVSRSYSKVTERWNGVKPVSWLDDITTVAQSHIKMILWNEKKFETQVMKTSRISNNFL